MYNILITTKFVICGDLVLTRVPMGMTRRVVLGVSGSWVKFFTEQWLTNLKLWHSWSSAEWIMQLFIFFLDGLFLFLLKN